MNDISDYLRVNLPSSCDFYEEEIRTPMDFDEPFEYLVCPENFVELHFGHLSYELPLKDVLPMKKLVRRSSK